MINFLRLIPTTAHQVLFLIAQIIILKSNGLVYSGAIAYVAAISSVLSIFLCLRWDIEILINHEDKIIKNLMASLITIAITTTLTLLINKIFGKVMTDMIIWSAFFLALHEVFVTVLIAKNKIYAYSIFRSIPALILVPTALSGMPASFAWCISFLSSTIFLSWYLRTTLFEALMIIDKFIKAEINFVQKFFAAAGSSLLPGSSMLLIIIINQQFGNEYVGIWSNTIRILNSAIIFSVTAMTPLMLMKIGNQDSQLKKTHIFLKFWMALTPLLLISITIVNTYGSQVLQIFLSTEVSIGNKDLIKIFLVSVTISFIGSAQGLYQSLNKNLSYLILLNLMVICLFIFYKMTFTNFTNLLTAFVILTFSTALLIFFISFIFRK